MYELELFRTGTNAFEYDFGLSGACESARCEISKRIRWRTRVHLTCSLRHRFADLR